MNMKDGLDSSEASLISSASRNFLISELHSAVFCCCIPEDKGRPEYSVWSPWSLQISSRRRYPRPSGNEAPLLLTHVFQRWRRTALDTPMLWACLHLQLTARVCNDAALLQGQLSALRFWMTHSREVPISVNVDFRLRYCRYSKVIGRIHDFTCSCDRRGTSETFTSMGESDPAYPSVLSNSVRAWFRPLTSAGNA